MSEFNVPEYRVSEVEEALDTLMAGAENARQSRRGSGRLTDSILTIDGMTSGGKSITIQQFHVNGIVSFTVELL